MHFTRKVFASCLEMRQVGAHGCAPYKPLVKHGLWENICAFLQA